MAARRCLAQAEQLRPLLGTPGETRGLCPLQQSWPGLPPRPRRPTGLGCCQLGWGAGAGCCGVPIPAVPAVGGRRSWSTGLAVPVVPGGAGCWHGCWAAAGSRAAAHCCLCLRQKEGMRLFEGGCCPAAGGSAARPLRFPSRRTRLREGSSALRDASLPTGTSPRWASGFSGGTLQGRAGGSARETKGLSCKFGGRAEETRLCEKLLWPEELGPPAVVTGSSRGPAPRLVGCSVPRQCPLAGCSGGC